MREPTMPGHTCPVIDKVKDNIEQAENYLYGLADKMEELRTANAQLRECAEYWQEQYEELKAEMDAAERET